MSIFDENLSAGFEVGQGTAHLFARLIVRQSGTGNLFAKFIRYPVFPASESLFANFETQVTKDLFARFIVKNASTAELYANFEAQAVVVLFAKFEAQVTKDLFTRFIVKNASTAELFARLIVKNASTVELFARFQRLPVFPDAEILFTRLIVRQPSSVDFYAKFEAQAVTNLFARFIVKKVGATELLGIFTVRHIDTTDLFSRLIVRNASSTDLFARFEAQVTIDLFAKLIVSKPGTANLFARFRRYPVFVGSTNLLATLFVGSDGSTDLFAQFIAQIRTYLFARFVVRYNASEEIHGRFNVWVHFGEGFEDLKAILLPIRDGYSELKAVTTIRNKGDEDLHAEFEAQAIIELFAKFEAQAVIELLGVFISRQSTTTNLLSVGIIRHEALVDLYAKFEVGQDSENLFTRAHIRGETSVDLRSGFWVRHPYWLWTTRRYINGVVDGSEALIGDAKLEYVVEGVMEDIQGFLAANEVSYAGWSDILLVPVLIRRATTYGVVAALYARHSKTFKSRTIATAAPVNVTVIGDDERAMQHWNGKMDISLERYLSTQSSPKLWTSTLDEEPIFTMADIPISEFGGVTTDMSWHEWLQRGS